MWFLHVIVLQIKKLEETSNQVHGQVWEHGANLLGYERHSPQQQAPSHVGNGLFFHPLEAAAEPTLQIGYVILIPADASWIR